MFIAIKEIHSPLCSTPLPQRVALIHLPAFPTHIVLQNHLQRCTTLPVVEGSSEPITHSALHPLHCRITLMRQPAFTALKVAAPHFTAPTHPLHCTAPTALQDHVNAAARLHRTPKSRRPIPLHLTTHPLHCTAPTALQDHINVAAAFTALQNRGAPFCCTHPPTYCTALHPLHCRITLMCQPALDALKEAYRLLSAPEAPQEVLDKVPGRTPSVSAGAEATAMHEGMIDGPGNGAPEVSDDQDVQDMPLRDHPRLAHLERLLVEADVQQPVLEADDLCSEVGIP
eukprot:1160964-Pelagomonas_calceolata.AAC.10